MTRSFSARVLAVFGLTVSVLLASAHSAAAQSPAAKAAIAKGVKYLGGALAKDQIGGEAVLGAYAMLKGGAKPTDPAVAAVLGNLTKSLAKGYSSVGNGIYAAGCELMLLEAASENGKKYRKEMQTIVDHIVKNQRKNGPWNYGGDDQYGDTSVTQYGVLGLWAAERAGIKVPKVAWDNVAMWLTRNQRKSGAFVYRPTEPGATEGETLSMTTAGVSSLLVARLHLYPNFQAGRPKKKPKKKGAVGDVRDDEGDGAKKPGKKKPAGNFNPNTKRPAINRAVAGGMQWSGKNFSAGGAAYPLYTLYGTERMAALAGVRLIGGHDWYAKGTGHLLQTQRTNGSWTSQCGEIPATAFAILFLSKATAHIVGHPEKLGGGLLRGGQGLPDDLSRLEEGKGGEIKKKRILTPIDELLEELKKVKDLRVPEIQKQIVEQIQLGDRKQWLQPKRRNQLLRMAEHPFPKVRKVAIWALGRTGNIDVVTVVIKALEKDPDLGVLIEARNALCWLSRRPRGFGLPEEPDFPEGATKDQKLKIVKRWQTDAVAQWKKWYLSVRPYAERDDLAETGGKRD